MGQPSGTIFTEPVLVVNQKVKDIHRRYWRRETRAASPLRVTASA
jgi:hypothetical protein